MSILTSSSLVREICAFSKAQISAFVGGVVDFGVMIFLTEIFSVHYLYSICIGGVVGAVVNFTINKNWSFSDDSSERSAGADSSTAVSMIRKFSVVVVGSILLKSWGTHFLTSLVQVDYRISRFIVDALVCFGFNYSMQRYWVFRKEKVS